MLLNDVYSQPTAADPVLEERLVLDLVRRHWRWPTHADRLALLHGYADDTPLSEEFMVTWHAALLLSDMVALATRPESRPQALERLRDLLSTRT